MSPDNPASESPLQQAALALAQHYNAQPQLVSEQRDWHRTIALTADDCDDTVRLEIRGGQVTVLSNPTSCAPSAASPSAVPADVVIRGSQALLARILRLQQLPSEPYLFGELVIEGPEPDFLRLDYIVTTLAQMAAPAVEGRR